MPLTQFNSPRSLLTFNSYSPDFVGKPIQQIGQSMLSRSNANRNIVNDASKLDIALSNLQVHPLDEDYLIQQKNEFKDAIKNIANNGNVNTAEASLNKVYHDYATNQGLKHAILRYNQYNSARAKVQSEKGKYDPDTYKYKMSIPFTKTTPDEHGFYNDFTLPDLSYKYDVNKLLSSIAKNVPTITRNIGVAPVLDNNGNQIGIKNVLHEYKDPETMHAALYNEILSNDNAINYAQQLVNVKNANGNYNVDVNGNQVPWTTKDVIDSWIKPIVQSYSGINDKSTYKFNKNATLPSTSKNDIFTINIGAINNDETKKLANASSNIEGAKNTSIGIILHNITNPLSPIDPFGKLTSNIDDIHNNISKHLDAGEQDILNNNANIFSVNTYGKQFDKLNSKQKLDIYSKVNKYFSSMKPQNMNISVQGFNPNTDKNEIAGFMSTFTQQPHGKLTNKDGKYIGSDNYKNYSYWDVKHHKYMKGSEFANDVIEDLPKNATVTIDGKTGYKNTLSAITGNTGFSTGIVFTVNGNQYIRADNPSNIKNRANIGASLLYNAAKSIAHGGDLNFPVGVPIGNNTIIKTKHPNAYYISLSPEDANGITRNNEDINSINHLYILDKHGNPILHKTPKLDSNGKKVLDSNGNTILINTPVLYTGDGKKLLEFVTINSRNAVHGN